jgi:hypothetical protein
MICVEPGILEAVSLEPGHSASLTQTTEILWSSSTWMELFGSMPSSFTGPVSKI